MIYHDFLLTYYSTAGFMQTKEGKAAAGLLDAFNKRDNDALKLVAQQQCFDFIDNEVAKIARKFTVSGMPSGNSQVEEDDPTSLA
jgi:hypothetical protein